MDDEQDRVVVITLKTEVSWNIADFDEAGWDWPSDEELLELSKSAIMDDLRAGDPGDIQIVSAVLVKEAS